MGFKLGQKLARFSITVRQLLADSLILQNINQILKNCRIKLCKKKEKGEASTLSNFLGKMNDF